MSDFASPTAAALVEEALALPHYEAIRRLTHLGVTSVEREEVVLAMAEALIEARTSAVARALVSDQTASDDVICSWRWGEAPHVDASSSRVGFSIMFGRRRLKLWLPQRDLLGMASSYISDTLRGELRQRLSPDGSAKS